MQQRPPRACYNAARNEIALNEGRVEAQYAVRIEEVANLNSHQLHVKYSPSTRFLSMILPVLSASVLYRMSSLMF